VASFASFVADAYRLPGAVTRPNVGFCTAGTGNDQLGKRTKTKGAAVYIGGGVIALIVIILLLIWIF
jgi:hypothetical protein